MCLLAHGEKNPSLTHDFTAIASHDDPIKSLSTFYHSVIRHNKEEKHIFGLMLTLNCFKPVVCGDVLK